MVDFRCRWLASMVARYFVVFILGYDTRARTIFTSITREEKLLITTDTVQGSGYLW